MYYLGYAIKGQQGIGISIIHIWRIIQKFITQNVVGGVAAEQPGT